MSARQFRESNHPALYYQAMLADRVRMARYQDAIRSLVRPGDVVADLGAGTAVLALMAVRAGAARVYAVENRPHVLPLAERIVQANGYGDRIKLVEADVREVQLAEPVDVIVNELIGDFGTDENIAECVRAFANRHLAPQGRILPRRLRTFLVPVQYGDEFRGVYRRDFHGFDLRPALDFPTQAEPVMYGLRHPPKMLAPAACAEDIAFGSDMPERAMPVSHTFEIDTGGVLQGFVGYFEAELSDGICLRSLPCYAGCHWQNWNWPVTPPRDVTPGQRIEATLRMHPNTLAAGWTLDWQLRDGNL